MQYNNIVHYNNNWTVKYKYEKLDDITTHDKTAT